MTLINNSGGFEVVLWYSRGEMNDQSLIGMNVQDDQGQVDAGKITYHIVDIKVMNRNFMNENTALGLTLKNMKFKVGEHL